MNVQQASTAWGVSEKIVREMAQYAGYKCDSIPDDCPGIYRIDGRKRKSYEKSGLKEYIVVLDAVALGYWIVIGKDGIVESRIRTAVRELKNKGLIVLIDGREAGSLDYRDYMVDLVKFPDWLSKQAAQKAKLISECVGIISGEITGRVIQNNED